MRLLPAVMALAGVMITGAGSSISECHAQQHLTLSQALELAQDRNTEIQRQQNQVALEANAVDQARAAFRPNLSLSVGSSTDLGRSFDETAGRLETRRSQRLSFRASSSMTLYDGSARQSELRVARLGLDVAEGDLKRTGGRIAYLTASQYLRTVAATKLIRVAEENLESQRLQLDRIQAYWEQGVRSHTDVLQQEAALASAELSLLNARQTRDAALLQLKELLGMGPGTSLELVDVELETEAPPEAGSVDQLVRAALEQRLEIRSQELLIEAAELGVSSARAQKLPSVGLSVSGGTSYSSTARNASFAGQLLDRNPSASIGLSMSVPVFDRGVTRTSSRRARLRALNQELALDEQRREIALAVQQAVLDVRAAAKKLDVAAAQRASAAEALAAMATRYQTGNATFVELSQTRAQSVNAEVSWVEALHERHMAEIALAYHLGEDALAQALTKLSGGS